MTQRRAWRIQILVWVAASFLLAGLAAPWLWRLEGVTGDWRLAFRHWVYRTFAVEQPGAAELCLIGIDEPTLAAFGKFGSGAWAVREPFLRLAPVLVYFHPSMVAFDLLFRPAGEQGPSGSSAAMPPAVTLGPELPAPGPELLLRLSRYAAQEAENYLSGAFSRVVHPPPGGGVGLPVVCAYDFPGLEGGPPSPPWTRAEVTGLDPAATDVANGLAVPYLLDVAIPAANLHGVPAEYHYAVNANLPAPVLRDSVQHGFINVPRDPDGLIRRVPLVIGFEYRLPDGTLHRAFVPSFALLAVLDHWRLTSKAVRVEFGRWLTIDRGARGVVRAPIDRDGRMPLNFTGRLDDYPNVSFRALLGAGEYALAAANGRHRLNAEELAGLSRARSLTRGRLCLTGLTAAGTTDIGPCPVDATTPYVHVHTTAAANLLSGRFLRVPGGGGTAAVMAALALLFAALSLQPRQDRFLHGAALLAMGWLTVAWLAIFADWLPPLATPLAGMAAAFAAVFSFRQITEEREKRRIRSMFSAMVSEVVLRYLEENPASASLAGRRAEATVLFSDLAGFTTMAERLAPEKVSELLNVYFNEMTEIILGAEGYLDKYEGDAIMAVWGVPYPMPGHALAACRAALRQREALARLRPVVAERFGVTLRARFGLNSGTVAAGNMGSRRRLQYTVIGDVVNLAARLEPLGKEYGVDIIIGEDTRQLAGPALAVRMLDRVVVVGKTLPSAIFELVAEADSEPARSRQAGIALYEDALRRHWERDWDGAETRLRQLLVQEPDDLAARHLRDRISRYRLHPPAGGWQGEIMRLEKD